MRVLGVLTLALSVSAVSAEWSFGDVLDSLGLGSLWPWHKPHHDKPVPDPVIPRPTSGDNWAVLVAGSNGWFNYRHQADVSHAYQILRRNGYPDSNIIVMMYDDIANDIRNPEPGKIINQPGGNDLYEGINIDYRGADVNPTVFLSVLVGQDPGVGSGKVLKSGPNDHVFINFVDHGGVGLISFPMGKIVTSKQLMDALNTMHTRQMYGELVFYMEACESGSMFENLLPPNINIFATTASTASQSSYATYWDLRRKTFLGDLYSVAWMEDSDNHFWGKGRGKTETLEMQYQNVYNRTKASSQPQQYGNMKIANTDTLEEFQAYAAAGAKAPEHQYLRELLAGPVDGANAATEVTALNDDVVDARDVAIESLKRMLRDPANAADVNAVEEQLAAEYRGLQQAQDRYEFIAYALAGNRAKTYVHTPVSKIGNHDCVSDALVAFVDECHAMDEHHIRFSRVLAHLCNDGYSAEKIRNVIKQSPACRAY